MRKRYRNNILQTSRINQKKEFKKRIKNELKKNRNRNKKQTRINIYSPQNGTNVQFAND